jgi:hypothetical protein
MLRRATEDGWLLFTQPDHASLSGALIGHWGNDRFVRPERFSEVVRATYEHDFGWTEWERAPEADPENGQPVPFTDLTESQYVEIWTRSADQLAEQEPYAALLVTSHSENLARMRLGRALAAGEERYKSRFVTREVPAEEAPVLRSFLEAMAARKAALAARLARADAGPDGVLRQARRDYRFVQLGDLASLELCHGLAGSVTIQDVPRGAGERIAITLRPAGPETVAVDPFPFSGELAVSVRARRIRPRAFASTEAFRETLARVPWETLTIRLQPTTR